MSRALFVSVLATSLVACFPQPAPYAPQSAAVPTWYQVNQAEVVPANAAPPPPAGRGWFCFDVAYLQDRSARTSSRCERTKADCARIADSHRTRYDQDVGFCAPHKTAICTATFTNASDARYMCTKQLDQCGPVGGPAPMLGIKHSECTAVN